MLALPPVIAASLHLFAKSSLYSPLSIIFQSHAATHLIYQMTWHLPFNVKLQKKVFFSPLTHEAFSFSPGWKSAQIPVLIN